MMTPDRHMLAQPGPNEARRWLKRARSVSPMDLLWHAMIKERHIACPTPPAEVCNVGTRSCVARHPSPMQRILLRLRVPRDLHPSQESKSCGTPPTPITERVLPGLQFLSHKILLGLHPFPRGCATACRLHLLQRSCRDSNFYPTGSCWACTPLRKGYTIRIPHLSHQHQLSYILVRETSSEDKQIQ